MADPNRRRNKIPPSSSKVDPPSSSHSQSSTIESSASKDIAKSSGVSVASQTNNNRNSGSRTKKPFTDSSYKSRFSDDQLSSETLKRPIRRRSIFVEELDLDLDLDITNTDINPTSAGTESITNSNNHIPNSNTAHPILAIHPYKVKESYIMQLPIQPFRFSLLLLLLVAFTTISLSTSAERDLDGLLNRMPAEEIVVEKREASIAPSFRIGPAVRNPQKDIPKLRTGILVLGIGCLVAGLMT
ncbi:hypothetical protein ABW19_dt0210281 [Dactylella cylindrospora]|nr:hypothetical protein ABW19_dt0210281 [Dactylella cylindrospora]